MSEENALVPEVDLGDGEGGILGRYSSYLSITGLNLPDGLAYEEWEYIGKMLGVMGRSLSWAAGDWLLYGENAEAIGERHTQAADLMQYDPKTLQNAVWVCQRFEPDRRREGLSFKHHEVVAALDEKGQDQWLDLAEENGWSVHEFRAHYKERKELEHGTRARSTEAHYYEWHVRWPSIPDEDDVLDKIRELVENSGGEVVKSVEK